VSGRARFPPALPDLSITLPVRNSMPRFSVFLDGLVTFVILKNVRSKSSQLFSLTVITDMAHEDVVPIIERLRELT
jgi:hypothetical protein